MGISFAARHGSDLDLFACLSKSSVYGMSQGLNKAFNAWVQWAISSKLNATLVGIMDFPRVSHGLCKIGQAGEKSIKTCSFPVSRCCRLPAMCGSALHRSQVLLASHGSSLLKAVAAAGLANASLSSAPAAAQARTEPPSHLSSHDLLKQAV